MAAKGSNNYRGVRRRYFPMLDRAIERILEKRVPDGSGPYETIMRSEQCRLFRGRLSRAGAERSVLRFMLAEQQAEGVKLK